MMRQCAPLPPHAAHPSRRAAPRRLSSRARARPLQPCLESEFDEFVGTPVTTFSERSAHGSGLVSVVARDRWRSLTFQSNEDAVATQQGLCLVDADGAALPGSLVFTYLRTAAAAVAALAPSPASIFSARA